MDKPKPVVCPPPPPLFCPPTPPPPPHEGLAAECLADRIRELSQANNLLLVEILKSVDLWYDVNLTDKNSLKYLGFSDSQLSFVLYGNIRCFLDISWLEKALMSDRSKLLLHIERNDENICILQQAIDKLVLN